MNILQELYDKNKKEIDDLSNQMSNTQKQNTISGLTYGFVECTLSEAQAFNPTTTEYRHITDARKSGEGVGLGTGLPAFYDTNSSIWVDMLGNAITV